MKLLKKRKRDFADFYTDIGSETYNNAERSAVKAGYSPRYARGNAYKLVSRGGISERIIKNINEINERSRKSREDKVKIAWQNYEEARKERRDRDAQKLFREHGELQGDYIQRIESEQKITLKQEQADEIAQKTREAIKQALINPQ